MSEPKKRLSTPLYFESQDQKDRFQKAAIESGMGSEKKPNVTGWLRMLGERECSHKSDDAIRQEAKRTPVVTFESMTAAEQWWALEEVSRMSLDSAVSSEAFRLQAQWDAEGKAEGWEVVESKHGGRSTPGYQARYDAALAYVKGVVGNG